MQLAAGMGMLLSVSPASVGSPVVQVGFSASVLILLCFFGECFDCLSL